MYSVYTKNGNIHKGQRLLSLIRLRYGSGNIKGSSSGSIVESSEISSRIICKRIEDSVQYQSNNESTFIKSVWFNTHALTHSLTQINVYTHTLANGIDFALRGNEFKRGYSEYRCYRRSHTLKEETQ